MGRVGGAFRRWVGRGDPFVALATVVQVYQSAPRQAGACLAVSGRGELEGSVSGGCIEGDVAHEAAEVIASGVPRLMHVGISDAQAWDAGLTCGGAIDLWVERLDAGDARWLADAWDTPGPTVAVTWLDPAPGIRTGTRAFVGLEAVSVPPGGPDVSASPAVTLARAAIADGHRATAGIRDADRGDGTVGKVFLDPFPGPPVVVIFGAVHVAQALVTLAHAVGFETVVIDPRATFATDDRIGEAGRVVRRWPQDAIGDGEVVLDGASYVVVLTHDPKLDEPALAAALRSPAPYVGCLGSRKTQALRRDRLRRDGVPEADIARIRGPVGLDIGARSPEEIALGIVAEMVAVARGGALGARRP